MHLLLCFKTASNGIIKNQVSHIVRKPAFAYAKTKTQISFAATAKLISAFVFATQKVQPLFFLNPKFQASSCLLWLHSPICVAPGRKPRRPFFSRRGSSFFAVDVLHMSLVRKPVFGVSDQVRHKLGCTIKEDG